MAYKTLIFGTDKEYERIKPLFDAEVKSGNLEIVANVDDTSKLGGGVNIDNVDLVIICNLRNFIEPSIKLESLGFSRKNIIDFRVFKMPNLDFPRLLKDGIAYGVWERNPVSSDSIVHPRSYSIKNSKTTVVLGNGSFIGRAYIEDGYLRQGSISLGNFSAIAWDVFFELGLNGDHNSKNVSLFGLNRFYWSVPRDFYPSLEPCKILIGNDVWIGRGCKLKSTNPDKPLVIGDGAVIASDSVVVKNVPPYAIVGGNPAQIIKYRFEPHIIEALLRIKWWDWSLDKIHDNFKYFNDVERFISMHDK